MLVQHRHHSTAQHSTRIQHKQMPPFSDYRTVLNYESTDDIVNALQHDASENDAPARSDENSPPPDWVLPVKNIDTTMFEQQSLEAEAERLSVLREYKVLETENEDDYDMITEEAGDFYNVPWACVSFVDMGRLWFKSMYKDDIAIKETPRKDSFCQYTLQSKEDLFVIRDTHQDERFSDNPYVTGHPGWRFYAGVPLVSPEGAKLGTFCLLDRKPRPQGLSVEDERKLKNMAKKVMERLVARKRKFSSGGLKKRPSTECLVELAASSGRPSAIADTCDDDEEMVSVKKSKLNPTRSFKTKMPTKVQKKVEPKTQIPSTVPEPILPDPKTAGVDPDAYLCDLVQALYGVKLHTKPALDLDGFFSKITEEQMAAYSMEVVTATRENDIAELRQIREKCGRDALDCFNRFGEGLLNLACRRGFKEITAYLLSDEVGLEARIRDDYGRTPLHDACWNPSPLVDICTWLMRKEPALFFVKDKRGFTPFQYARKSDWLVWRQFLFDRRDLLQPLTRSEILEKFSS